MREISFDELKGMAQASAGSINKIYLHWSAGRHGQYWPEYHINVDADGTLHSGVTSLKEHLSHTLNRNGGAVGMALCACYNAEPDDCARGDFGEEPPTPAMIDAMGKAVAVLCKYMDLVPTKDFVLTHDEVARLDGYWLGGPDPDCRWDLLYLPDLPGDGEIKNGGDIIRGKAEYYLRRDLV